MNQKQPSPAKPTETKDSSIKMESIFAQDTRSESSQFVQQSKISFSGGGPIDSTTFIIIISLIHGLFDISSLSSFFYQKNILQLEPQTIQMLAGVIGFPWCIKPIFGYMSDSLIKRLKKTKYLIMISSFIRIILFSILTHMKPGFYMFYAICFINGLCSLFENIISEYTLVVNTKRINDDTKTKGNNQLPIYFGFRAFGGLIGNFLGGRIMKYHSMQMTFFICSLLPFATLTFAFLYNERAVTINEEDERSFADEFEIMKQLLFRDKVLMLIAFICLINMTPNFDMLVTFYLTDYLNFSTEDLANFSSFATVCYILGLLLYSYYFQSIKPKKFYIATNFILWIFNMSFLLVVLKVLDKIGINTKLFCLLSQGATSFIAELNFMPILAIWCSICPENLEATSITLFTGLLNFSGNLSNYLGGILIWSLNIHKTNYDKLWQPIVIQNSYLLVMMVCIAFVEFPDPSQESEENKAFIEDRKDKDGAVKMID